MCGILYSISENTVYDVLTLCPKLIPGIASKEVFRSQQQRLRRAIFIRIIWLLVVRC